MTDAGPDTLVRVEHLSRRFGAVQAVADVSFEVRRGEMLGLIGPDGAGKTTSLRAILGLLKPDSGSLRTLGLDPLRERRRLSSRVGYLSQRFSLYGDLSVDENVAFFAEIHDVGGYAEKRDALLELVRMTPFRERLADRLSGGMKQKLALVCTLVHTPELLVLDEPTTGVDPVSRRDFWKILYELLRGFQAARDVVIAEHHFVEALLNGPHMAGDSPAVRLQFQHLGPKQPAQFRHDIGKFRM